MYDRELARHHRHRIRGSPATRAATAKGARPKSKEPNRNPLNLRACLQRSQDLTFLDGIVREEAPDVPELLPSPHQRPLPRQNTPCRQPLLTRIQLAQLEAILHRRRPRLLSTQAAFQVSSIGGSPVTVNCLLRSRPPPGVARPRPGDVRRPPAPLEGLYRRLIRFFRLQSSP